MVTLKRTIPSVFKIICIMLLCLCLASVPVFGAEASPDAPAGGGDGAYEDVSRVSAELEATLNALAGLGLTDAAGTTDGDWFLMAAGRSPYRDTAIDRGETLRKLESYVTEKYRTDSLLDRVKATEWHRIALTVSALGGDPRHFGARPDGTPIDLVADGTWNRPLTRPLDAQGTNGLIFALVTVHSKDYTVPEDAAISYEEIAAQLFDRQLPDGGFALAGTQTETDMTAMALQALAGITDQDRAYGSVTTQTAKQIIEQALNCLSALQNEDGSYSQYGTANCESAAQVITALCQLGIDPETDSRFVKGGATLLEALDRFRLEDGTYTHTLESPVTNAMASGQAAMALTAYLRLKGGQSAFFDMTDQSAADEAVSAPVPETGLPGSETGSPAKAAPFSGRAGWKWIAGGITAAGVLITAVLLLRKKKAKLLWIPLSVGIAAALLLCFLNIETADQHKTDMVTVEHPAGSVTLSINCQMALDNYDRLDPALKEGNYLPKDGWILPETVCQIQEGDSVFNVLQRACAANNVQMEYQGSDLNIYKSNYVQGIQYLYEFSCGELSGWMYQVNGVYPQVGSSSCSVSDGDRIDIIYTCDLGRDVGDDYARSLNLSSPAASMPPE